MTVTTPRRRLGRIGTLAVAAAGLVAVALPLTPAKAQIYLGWDFGNGFGVGIGTPPSAYTPYPNYGWPVYPYRPYYYYPY